MRIPSIPSRLREGLVGRYANEEVEPAYDRYPSGYTTPKPIPEQVEILRKIFPQLASASVDESFARVELPAGAEGYFAIPRWQIFAPTYCEALQIVLDAVKKDRGDKFSARLKEGRHIAPQYLRQHFENVEAFQKLEELQPGCDILVVPCQFGLEHIGRSIRRAREVMLKTEFGLGAFAVGVMLLTHPERIGPLDDFPLSCSGDEFISEDGSSFNDFLFFWRFEDDWDLWITDSPDDYPHPWLSTTSGFFSQ